VFRRAIFLVTAACTVLLALSNKTEAHRCRRRCCRCCCVSAVPTTCQNRAQLAHISGPSTLTLAKPGALKTFTCYLYKFNVYALNDGVQVAQTPFQTYATSYQQALQFEGSFAQSWGQSLDDQGIAWDMLGNTYLGETGPYQCS
jgi:hypothetical protein